MRSIFFLIFDNQCILCIGYIYIMHTASNQMLVSIVDQETKSKTFPPNLEKYLKERLHEIILLQHMRPT